MGWHFTKRVGAPWSPHNKREVMSSIARNYLNQLNADYLQVHRRKEDLFWSTYMGTSDDQAGFTAAEQAYKAFCADPARLPVLREMHAQAEEADLRRGLGAGSPSSSATSSKIPVPPP